MPKSVVVIGAGVGGLSAAIYSRLRGFDVLLLEAGGLVGGKAASREINGYRLDPGPSIVILPRIYRQLFADAGRNADTYLEFQRLDPISQVRFEGNAPLDLPADSSACLELIGRTAPEDADAFARLMRDLEEVAPRIDRSIFAHSYDRPWQLFDPHLMAFAKQFDIRATYKQLIDQRFKSGLMRAFFYGFPSYGGQTYDSRAAGALLIPYFMLVEGVFYPKGGVGSIPAAMEKLARELGVEIRTGSRVSGARNSRGRVRSVLLEGGEGVAADAFISNVDRSTTLSWFGDAGHAQPSFSYFTVHLGLRRKLDGLAHHTLLIPKDFEQGFEALYRRRAFPNPPIVYLNLTSVHDPGAAPPGCTNLFTVISTPAEEDGLEWDRDERRYRDAVIAQVRQFGIAINEDEIEFERIQSPSYFARAHGNYRGSLYGVDEKHRLFGGMFPQANRDRQFSNLFYCGGSVQPGAGLPMVTLSGKFAAEMI